MIFLRNTLLWLFLSAMGCFTSLSAQSTVGFSSSALSGVTLNNPTSLQFGPDDRLYVAQQNGFILAYTVVRSGTDQYRVTATETISVIRDIPNHNDDGALNTTVKDRQITGILVTGSASAPVLYVSSSDPRIGGGGTGGDKNLDTNSGVVSKLTRNGTSWVRQDIVLGLPRSEENHAVNGMQLDEAAQILYLAVGGHTNAGAPSNNFAFLTEYALSAAILKIDLMRVQNEFGGRYVLPTLDDPTRANSQAGGGDVNDPFGGNDGLNQAKLVEGGPVQIHSAGYRNAYDLVLTRTPGRENRLYTIDNGANGGWGGHPDQEGVTGDPPVTKVTNNYVVGEPGSTGPGPNDAKVNNLDNLHLVSKPGMKPIYGGHPTPIRANPLNAGLYRFDNATGKAVFEIKPTSDWPPVPAVLANPVEGDFRNPGVNDGALYTWTESTNGLTEYTSESYFSGELAGDLIAASYDGALYRIRLSADGTAVLKVESLASGFGSIPLDVTAPGKGSLFEGTIWAATYGSDAITVFEPSGGWQTVNSSDGSAPLARHECGWVESGGKFHLLGGRETTRVDVFDPTLKKWSAGGDMPFKMHHFQPVAWQGKIYVIGAYQGTYSTGNVNNSESPVTSVFVYDPSTKFWTQGAPIPRPRGAAGLVMINNEFYLLGGIVNGHQDGWVRWVDKYNPTTGVWTSLPDMPRERDHFQAVVIDGRIYLAGGRKTNASGNVFGTTVPQLDVFDPVAQVWSTLGAAQSLPVPRAGAMNVVRNSELFIVGGESESQRTAHNQVHSFDPKTGIWRTHPVLPTGRHGTGMIAWNDRFFVAAGATQQGGSGTVSTLESLYFSKPCDSDPNSTTVDADGDGFSNGDETLNGTNYCSSASRPADADGDLVSDRLDSDDDNDGRPDVTDRFVLDPTDGSGFSLPAFYPFLNGDPGTGFFGLGFTGIMSNGKNDYLDLFDPSDPELIMGGAVGIANVPAVSGDALSNNQKYAFQYGFRIKDQSFITIKSVIQGPFFGGATASQLTQQSQGIFIGTGDQDNYIKLVLSANNGKPGFRIMGENGGTVFVDRSVPVPDILKATSIRLSLGVDPVLSTVSFSYWIPGLTTSVGLGDPVVLPGSYAGIWAGQSALAAGIMASSGNAPRFSASWDYMQVGSGGRPELKPNLPDQYTRIAGSDNNLFSLDLNSVFEANGSVLSHQLQSVSANSFIASSAVSENRLNISLLSGKTGSASVTVRASNEEGAYADYVFVLKVVAPPATVKLINTGGSAYSAWSADAHFSGGKLYSSTVPIANTVDDVVYQTERYGAGFSYSIPMVSSGYYQLKLHFAEIYHGVKNKLGVGARLMDISAEGKLVLDDFDIFRTAGGTARAVTVTIDSVHVIDSFFDLKFVAVKDQAKISGIQIAAYATENMTNRPPVVVNPGKIFFFEGAAASLQINATDLDPDDVLTYSIKGLPASLMLQPSTGQISGTVEADPGVYPVTVSVSDGREGVTDATFDIEVLDPMAYVMRVNAGGPVQTFGAQVWRADQYFVGGNTYTKSMAISDTDLDAVFQSERYGKFGYQIPVPGIGRFKVRMLFAEKYFNGPGLRSFNILLESGAVKRSALDVFAAAGGSFKAYQEQFIVDVNDGILDVQFESLINNAMIGGIEVTACAQPFIQSVSASAAEVCSGSKITLTVAGQIGSADHWVLYADACGGTPLMKNTSGVFEVTPLQSATYFIRAEGACVAQPVCTSVSVSVMASPAISSLEASEIRICDRKQVTLTLRGDLGAASSWQLFTSDRQDAPLARSASGVFEVVPERTGDYVVMAEGMCATSATSASVRLLVDQPEEVMSFTADREVICEGELTELRVEGMYGVAQAWELFEAGREEQAVAVSVNGRFDVSPDETTVYFVRPVGGCVSGKSSGPVQIKVRQRLGLPSVSVDQTGPACSGTRSSIRLNGPGVQQERWKLTAGSCTGGPQWTSMSGAFEVSPQQTTTYFLSTSDGCYLADSCLTVVVHRVDMDITVSEGDGMLRSSDSGPGLEWFDCRTGSTVGEPGNPVFVPEESGRYGLRVNREGCAAVSECKAFIVASAAADAAGAEYFPNPVDGIINVSVPEVWGPADVSILDEAGRVLIRSSAEPGVVRQLDVQWLSSGSYLIRFAASGTVFTGRFLKN